MIKSILILLANYNPFKFFLPYNQDKYNENLSLVVDKITHDFVVRDFSEKPQALLYYYCLFILLNFFTNMVF